LKDQSKLKSQESNNKPSGFELLLHDLKTPLIGITYNLKLIDKSNFSDTQSNQIDNINKTCDSLIELIEKYSQNIARPIDINPTINYVDLHDCINNVVNNLNPIAENKNIKLVLKYDDSILKKFKSDPVLLKQLLYNLIHNAIKYSNAGNVHINCSISDSNDTIFLSIEDEGIGISEENLKTLDLAYYQVEKKEEGIGLGLYICKKICDSLGYKINFQSEKNSGTKVTIDMPTNAQLSNKEPLDELKEFIQHFHYQRVLLIEDSDIQLIYLKSLIKEVLPDSKVDCYTHEEILNHSLVEYELIIVDLHSKNNTMASLMDLILTSCDLNRVIATSASSKKESQEILDSFSIKSFLPKPITKEHLINVLWEVYIKTLNSAPLIDVSDKSNIKTLDWSLALERTNQNENLAMNLFLKFKKQLPEEMIKIDLAFKDKNYEDISYILHSLKGVSCYLGLPAFENVIDNYDKNLTKNNHSVISELHKALKVESDKISKINEKILKVL